MDIVSATCNSIRSIRGASEADDDVLWRDLQGVRMINHYILHVA